MSALITRDHRDVLVLQRVLLVLVWQRSPDLQAEWHVIGVVLVDVVGHVMEHAVGQLQVAVHPGFPGAFRPGVLSLDHLLSQCTPHVHRPFNNNTASCLALNTRLFSPSCICSSGEIALYSGLPILTMCTGAATV